MSVCRQVSLHTHAACGAVHPDRLICQALHALINEALLHSVSILRSEQKSAVGVKGTMAKLLDQFKSGSDGKHIKAMARRVASACWKEDC